MITVSIEREVNRESSVEAKVETVWFLVVYFFVLFVGDVATLNGSIQFSRWGDCMKSAEFLFTIGNALILPCWALIIFFPRSRVTDRVFRRSGFSPLHLLALIYVLAVVPALLASPEALVALARPTLEGVMALLGTESGAAAGWIHYLCFDLFVGVTVWKTAAERAHSFLWVSPILAMVLMLGPLGWLCYEVTSKVVSWRKS